MKTSTHTVVNEDIVFMRQAGTSAIGVKFNQVLHKSRPPHGKRATVLKLSSKLLIAFLTEQGTHVNKEKVLKKCIHMGHCTSSEQGTRSIIFPPLCTPKELGTKPPLKWAGERPEKNIRLSVCA
ncbi:hypothetical protein BaRGS_00034702 [Batillaria attramentaria]|uniref:Uncharacterized protein n=1 Tax=Batillaria attramentaria TaxID=370345 RepID=A0ABD0JGA6_9CAEN